MKMTDNHADSRTQNLCLDRCCCSSCWANKKLRLTLCFQHYSVKAYRCHGSETQRIYNERKVPRSRPPPRKGKIPQNTLYRSLYGSHSRSGLKSYEKTPNPLVLIRSPVLHSVVNSPTGPSRLVWRTAAIRMLMRGVKHYFR
jgi:hypothetical protein